ncbi:hypothetical protein QO206_03300 [Leeuwenhoekiella aequorea]|uniref:hypothetical protein n=1 Tax=Leeuwenhoekiella aequorea TaxID=283736 RepID=UPI00352C948F
MKGQYSLYDNLIFTPIEPSHSKPNLARRADAIAYRYYYYGSLCRMLYEDCVHKLHLEFFLEPDTIYNELKKRTSLVNRLVNERTTVSELRKLYPHFDWSGRVNLPGL